MPEDQDSQLATKDISAETWLKHYRRFLMHGEFEEAVNLRRNYFSARAVPPEEWTKVDREIRDLISMGTTYKLHIAPRGKR